MCYNIASFLYFFSLSFGHEARGILTPRPGIEPTPPALEGEVLTTGPPGKPQTATDLSDNQNNPKLVPKNETLENMGGGVFLFEEGELGKGIHNFLLPPPLECWGRVDSYRESEGNGDPLCSTSKNACIM